jgi:GxxExxY protein
MDRNYTYRLLKCLYEVHSQLGPGLLESIYEEAVAKELTAQGFHVERQVPVPVFYKGERLQNDLRLDLIVDDCIILELKSVTEYRKLFEKQLFTYLVLKNCEMGYVVNFNEESLRDVIHGVYNSCYTNL